MALHIEDYALIGDTQTAALVGRDGLIDWLCLPRFDSDACFAALLGTPEHGRWLLAPRGSCTTVNRRYRSASLVLDTELATEGGVVRLTDCMPPRAREPDLVRTVRCTRGRVAMVMELKLKMAYGRLTPWVGQGPDSSWGIAGPDAVSLFASVPTFCDGPTLRAEFELSEGEEASFVLAWHPSHEKLTFAVEAGPAIADTEAWWEAWAARCTYDGPWRDAVLLFLVTLKALTYAPTGGIVAAATTSLPEKLGGVRNWDYRYCWIRDATFTLYALLSNGYAAEARAWRDWLLRAAAGDPSQLQIMYGLAGERRLTELELPWLPGYERSAPVRIGNRAVEQFQLDVFGELMDCLYQGRRVGIEGDPDAWRLQRALLDFLESAWERPDEGIWEVRGPKRHFTHSKVMAWVAFDRAIKAVRSLGVAGPVERWSALRSAIHREVCERGFDPGRKTFTQYYGSSELDASLLMIPEVGFLPVTDPRVAGTVAAIERELLWDGFVLRYPTQESVDGLPEGEGVFLACSFWLADSWALLGRTGDARRLFERLLALCNDVGLLSEEYNPALRRMVGNFPQAFSHVGLINTALNLGRARGPATHRSEQG